MLSTVASVYRVVRIWLVSDISRILKSGLILLKKYGLKNSVKICTYIPLKSCWISYHNWENISLTAWSLIEEDVGPYGEMKVVNFGLCLLQPLWLVALNSILMNDSQLMGRKRFLVLIRLIRVFCKGGDMYLTIVTKWLQLWIQMAVVSWWKSVNWQTATLIRTLLSA